MLIQMIHAAPVAVSGFTRWYKPGQEIDVPDNLASALIRDRIAKTPDALAPAHQSKSEMKQPHSRKR